MRTIRFALLASAAVLFAACADGVVAPAERGAVTPGAESLNPFFTATTSDSTASDSVVAGYGCHATGGLEYECFEYEPCTGTEYVVCPDTTGSSNDPEFTDSSTGGTTGGTSSGTTGGTSTGGTSGGTTSGGTSSGTTAPQDSVTSGYGSESTGGIDYDHFEYDPETGTEPVVTSDPDDGGN